VYAFVCTKWVLAGIMVDVLGVSACARGGGPYAVLCVCVLQSIRSTQTTEPPQQVHKLRMNLNYLLIHVVDRNWIVNVLVRSIVSVRLCVYVCVLQLSGTR